MLSRALGFAGCAYVAWASAPTVAPTAHRLPEKIRSPEDECSFEVEPATTHAWDPKCAMVEEDTTGCNADGKHMECRFCGMENFPPCPTCEFEHPPETKYFWDVRCKAGETTIGCNADGIHFECRWCGDKDGVYVECPQDKKATSTTTVAPTTTTAAAAAEDEEDEEDKDEEEDEDQDEDGADVEDVDGQGPPNAQPEEREEEKVEEEVTTTGTAAASGQATRVDRSRPAEVVKDMAETTTTFLPRIESNSASAVASQLLLSASAAWIGLLLARC